jgi:hypothetical protein
MSAWLKLQRLSNLVGVLFQPCTTINDGVTRQARKPLVKMRNASPPV